MHRVVIGVVALVLGTTLAAGCGASHRNTLAGPVAYSRVKLGGPRPWLVIVAHKQAKYYGDPRAAITRIEFVRIRGARPGHERWAMIQMKSRRTFRVGCPRPGPGVPGPCGAHYLVIGVDLANHEAGIYWGLTASEVAAIARARHARARFRIFPDTSALYLRCAIPRAGPANGSVAGTCSTVTVPSDHVRRVEFVETWRNGGSANESKAVWAVTLSRDGHIQSIRVKGQPPQLVP